jgi:hypothetical protein
MADPSYFNDLAAHFARLAIDESQEAMSELRQALLVRDSGTYEKHIIPYLACRALVSKGPIGIEALAELLPQAPGAIYPMAILATLWRASEGQHAQGAFEFEASVAEFNKPIPPEVQRLARDKFVLFLDECRTDPEALYRLISLLHQGQLRAAFNKEAGQNFHDAVFRLLADTTLRISERSISGFEQLLNSGANEEAYQTFLAANPVFLNPLASQLISKQRLGDDFITDFVLELLTGDYLAVEIEKPTDPIFTAANDFSHQFTHAFGQVIDFVEWIEQNIAYAQKKLPGISSPRGLLVIGRRNALTSQQSDKLRRFNRNSATIEVLTFDDVLSRARSLLHNIRIRASNAERVGRI